MEEDIEICKEILNKMKKNNFIIQYKDLYIEEQFVNTLENILNELERLQKEFKAVDHECSRLEQKEIELENKKCLHCGNDTPLYCETCYQELIGKNAELQLENEKLNEYIFIAPNLNEMTAIEYQAIQQRAYIQGIAEEQERAKEMIYKYYIPKQVIRDKIQLLEKELKLLDKNDKHTLIENDYIISVLKELLGE